jgi:hypothetical protein
VGSRTFGRPSRAFIVNWVFTNMSFFSLFPTFSK